MYKSKVWPTVSGFEPKEAIQRLCGLADAQGMGKPSAHSLIMTNQVLYHMFSLVLQGLCHFNCPEDIFDIPSIGLRVYESKAWTTMLGFEPRKAIQRMCGFADT